MKSGSSFLDRHLKALFITSRCFSKETKLVTIPAEPRPHRLLFPPSVLYFYVHALFLLTLFATRHESTYFIGMLGSIFKSGPGYSHLGSGESSGGSTTSDTALDVWKTTMKASTDFEKACDKHSHRTEIASNGDRPGISKALRKRCTTLEPMFYKPEHCILAEDDVDWASEESWDRLWKLEGLARLRTASSFASEPLSLATMIENKILKDDGNKRSRPGPRLPWIPNAKERELLNPVGSSYVDDPRITKWRELQSKCLAYQKLESHPYYHYNSKHTNSECDICTKHLDSLAELESAARQLSIPLRCHRSGKDSQDNGANRPLQEFADIAPDMSDARVPSAQAVLAFLTVCDSGKASYQCRGSLSDRLTESIREMRAEEALSEACAAHLRVAGLPMLSDVNSRGEAERSSTIDAVIDAAEQLEDVCRLTSAPRTEDGSTEQSYSKAWNQYVQYVNSNHRNLPFAAPTRSQMLTEIKDRADYAELHGMISQYNEERERISREEAEARRLFQESLRDD